MQTKMKKGKTIFWTKIHGATNMKNRYLFTIFILASLNGIAQEQNVKVDEVIWNVRLNEPYMFNYQKNDKVFKVFPEKKNEDISFNIATKFIKSGLDTTKNFIYPVHKLSFNYDSKKVEIIKFAISIDSVFSSIQTLIFLQEYNSFIWQEKEISELINIQTAIQYLKPDSFWAFYNSEPSGIKEIDAIKTQFKDSEGILDIDKLGAYLATKPKTLAKYCDY
jgi:hypothetical protein